jgi:hypothetical protein
MMVVQQQCHDCAHGGELAATLDIDQYRPPNRESRPLPGSNVPVRLRRRPPVCHQNKTQTGNVSMLSMVCFTTLIHMQIVTGQNDTVAADGRRLINLCVSGSHSVFCQFRGILLKFDG